MVACLSLALVASGVLITVPASAVAVGVESSVASRPQAGQPGTVTTYYLGATEVTLAPVAGNLVATARRNLTSPTGTPIATQTRPALVDDWTFLLGDPQQSIRFTLNQPQAALGGSVPGIGETRPTYYPFGAPTTPAAQGTPSSEVGERGYLNKPIDTDGSIRLDHRNYTPSHNLLTTPDPLLDLGQPQSLNPYAYARNNPVAMSDPNGLEPRPWHDSAGYGGPWNPRGESTTGDAVVWGSAYQVPIDPNDTAEQQAAAERVNSKVGIAYESLGGDLFVDDLLRLLVFDWEACESVRSCALEVAFAVPILKPVKAIRVVEAIDDARDAERARDAANAGDDVVRALPRGRASLTQGRLDHIVYRHWSSSGFSGVGKFADGTSVRSLRSMIDDVARNGTIRPNTGGRPGTIFERDLGQTIGFNGAGNATSRLRVVVAPDGTVVTAFPY